MIKSKYDTEQTSIKLGIVFSKFGLAPNTWTVLAIIPAVLGFLSLYYHELLPALIFFVISGFIDAIDGAVARVTGKVTSLGAFLDGIIDRYVEILLYFGLMGYLWGTGFLGLPTPFWVVLLVFGAVMPSFVTSYADHRKVVTEPEAQRRMGGFMERFERLTLIYVGMFFGFLFGNRLWIVLTVAVVAILSNLTAIQRIIFVVRYKE